LILAGVGGGVALVLRLAMPGATLATSGAASSDEASLDKRSGVESAVHETSQSSTAAPVKLPDSHVDPDVARKVALERNKGRFNAFFDERVFLANSVSEGKLSVDALKGQLLSTDELKALPANVHVLTGKPSAVVERMAMIDTLEAMSEDDPTALDALVEIGAKPIDGSLEAQVKRAVAAEKYDVFVALARKNWELAKDTYLALENPALKDLLKPALIGGLVDSGLSRAQAVSTVDALATQSAPADRKDRDDGKAG
jgi:hypothetical protein